MSGRLVRVLLSSLFIQAMILLEPTKGKCGRDPVDIIFVLDESGSIWGPDFLKQLKFVQDLIDGFDVGPEGTHVGVETFGTSVRTIVQLGEFNDVDQLKRHIGAISQRRGSTGTHLALMKLREMFSPQYTRPGAKRVAIVITDGESDKPKDTASEAEIVHADGVTVFAIGVGRVAQKWELENIASDNEYVFTVENYNDLNSLLDILAIKACPVEETTSATVPPPPPSTKSWPPPLPATKDPWETAIDEDKRTTTESWIIDPVVPIPKSFEGCIGSMTFNIYFGLPDQMSLIDTYLTLQFIKELTTLFSGTTATIRPSLCPRICPVVPCWASESYCHLPWNNNIDFIRALEDRRAQSVSRHDLQLGYIKRQEDAYRQWARKDQDEDSLASLAVLLIDNRFPDTERMVREAAYAKQDGIQILTIGVGDYVDRKDLWKIASTEKDLLHVRSYAHLPTLQKTVTERVCMRGLVKSAADLFD